MAPIADTVAARPAVRVRTGECMGCAGYSPAMCVFIDFVDRLGLLT